MSDAITLWDWEREPMPDARVVACRPGLTPAALHDGVRGSSVQWVIVADWWQGHETIACSGLVPALYVERQTDLLSRNCDGCAGGRDRAFAAYCDECDGHGEVLGIRSLLAIQAGHRALVICPRKEIDLNAPGLWEATPGQDIARPLLERIDLVAIVPPPEPDPWPLHPAWVRKIVEQCRAVDVAVVFLGWGTFVTYAQAEWNTTRSFEAWFLSLPDDHRVLGVVEETQDRFGDAYKERFWRVGRERSGRLLDGAEVMDLPEWLVSEVS